MRESAQGILGGMGSIKGFGGLSALRNQVPDATKPIADHGDLEAAIERDPSDVAAYLVYADVLQRVDDPRGVLISLQAAQLDRPEDAELAGAIARQLAGHALYFLGGLASAVEARTIAVEWFCGFIRRIEIVGPLDLDPIDMIATIPSCRFVREIVLGTCEQDRDAIVDRLLALRRPRTLEAIDLGAEPSARLAAAFPRLAENLVALEAVLAAVKDRRPGDGELVNLTESQARARLARLDHEEPDGFVDVDIDLAVFARGGAIACGGGRVAELLVPERSLVVDGDLVITGVLEQPAGTRLLILGNLTCRSLCTAGQLVVLGDLVVEEVFFGCAPPAATIVHGTSRIATLLIHEDHPVVVYGGYDHRVELASESHGSEALARVVGEALDFPSVAARLRETR